MPDAWQLVAGVINIVILKDVAAVTSFDAGIYIKQIDNTPNSVSCLATGSTRVASDKELIAAYQAVRVSFCGLSSFNLGE